MTKLIDYLKDAAVLECQLFAQEELDRRLEKTIRRLGKPKKIERPVMTEISTKNELIGAILVGTLTLLGFIVLFIGGLQDGFGYVLETSGGIILMFVGGLIFSLVLFYKHKKEVELNEKIYRKAMMQYNREVSMDNARMKSELAMKGRLQTQQKMVREAIKRTHAALNALYALDIIHPAYRSVIPVTSFYDYFEKGICTELTGFGGAYARYDEDLRFERIERKLDVIIRKLDQIIANQRTIGSLLRSSLSTLNRIEEQNNSMRQNLDRIQENSELTAYNTRCIAQSAAVVEHIAFYRAMKSE